MARASLLEDCSDRGPRYQAMGPGACDLFDALCHWLCITLVTLDKFSVAMWSEA